MVIYLVNLTDKPFKISSTFLDPWKECLPDGKRVPSEFPMDLLTNRCLRFVMEDRDISRFDNTHTKSSFANAYLGVWIEEKIRLTIPFSRRLDSGKEGNGLWYQNNVTEAELVACYNYSDRASLHLSTV